MRAKLIDVSSLSNAQRRQVIDIPTAARMPVVPDLLTGIEIEGEEVQWSVAARGATQYAGWSMHGDGSLRDGIEFVLSQPLHGAPLGNAIETFYNTIDSGEGSLRPNPRAGTHVHINLSDQSFGVVQAMFTIMYCIDRMTFMWAGDDRQWCSYCNSINVLSAHTIRSVLRDDELMYVDRNWVWPLNSSDRYYGFNVGALFKYGTIEFRYFQTTLSREEMWDYVDFCQLVFAKAKQFADSCPEDTAIAQHVLEAVLNDPEAFITDMFSPAYRILNAMLNVPEWERGMLEAAEELSLILTIDQETEAVVEDQWVPISYFSEDDYTELSPSTRGRGEVHRFAANSQGEF